MIRLLAVFSVFVLAAAANGQDSLPFSHAVEVFQHEKDDVRAFVVRLTQPFLAEEFEKSNYIRLKALDDNAFLIYPSETRFAQRHAEFYGRLRGDGVAAVQISYEVVSENPDGTRRVDSREANIEIPVPTEPSGSESIYKTWAEFQNQHFARLLRYYPDETFFEFLLLQSRQRYGVTPPSLQSLSADAEKNEENVYHLFSGGLELQQSLQRSAMRGVTKVGDLDIHISSVRSPQVKSLDYEELLKTLKEDGGQPHPHEVAALVPDDQYLVTFNSWDAANNLYDSSQQWMEPMLRMMTTDARDHGLRAKYEHQLGIRFDDLQQWFADGTVTDLSVTGSDFYIAEGTDLTLLVKTANAAPLQARLEEWSAETAAQHTDFEDRSFNYRGVRIQARYTPDRSVSSFVLQHEAWMIVSNSHVGIRRVVETIQKRLPTLADAPDYQYATALHPSTALPGDGYVYLSDNFLRFLISPQFKVAERRRKQSLNNLIMLNNASLFWRLEYGTAPKNLDNLIEGRFIDRDKIVCPQGGAYSYDPESDTSVSSVFNRIKHLTPIRELNVLQISSVEEKEYSRYCDRYQSFWKDYFTPFAMRFSTADSLKADYCLLPFPNSTNWTSFRDMLSTNGDAPLVVRQPAKSAIASVDLMAGREILSDMLKGLPGVSAVLNDDPTLTDMNWIGDRASINFCDTHALVEIDPAELKPLTFPFPLSTPQQAAIATAVFSTISPVYLAIDLDDTDKADRFLKMLSSRIFQHEQQGFGELTSDVDSYRLPPHRERDIYVASYRLYALRIRLYLCAVGDQLVIATSPQILREVIDVALDGAPRREVDAQFAVRLRLSAMNSFRDDLRTYWEERARKASHRNIMPIYTLIHLYGAKMEDIDTLSDAKYGVTYFCPDGEYSYDAERDQVSSSAYGNREDARQTIADETTSSFARAFGAVSEVLFTVKFSERSITGHLEFAAPD